MDYDIKKLKSLHGLRPNAEYHSGETVLKFFKTAKKRESEALQYGNIDSLGDEDSFKHLVYHDIIKHAQNQQPLSKIMTHAINESGIMDKQRLDSDEIVHNAAIDAYCDKLKEDNLNRNHARTLENFLEVFDSDKYIIFFRG